MAELHREETVLQGAYNLIFGQREPAQQGEEEGESDKTTRGKEQYKVECHTHLGIPALFPSYLITQCLLSNEQG